MIWGLEGSDGRSNLCVFGVYYMVGFAKDVDVKFVVNRLIEVARIW